MEIDEYIYIYVMDEYRYRYDLNKLKIDLRRANRNHSTRFDYSNEGDESAY